MRIPCSAGGLGAATALLAVLLNAAPASAVTEGQHAPRFALGNLQGNLVDSKGLAGHPYVLVVGTAKEAAVSCRDWMLALHKNLETAGVPVYQVIVLNNPWYVPHFAVVDQVRGFVPAFGQSLVLLEWKRGFGDAYAIPYDFDPRVIVVDADQTVRHVHQGTLDDDALAGVLMRVDALTASR